MKKTVALLLISLGLSAFAGDDAWLTNYEQAKQQAADQGKHILINFTGSDWCGWCKRLDREVFSKSDFQDFAAANLVLLKLDFPKHTEISAEQKAHNEKLASKFGVRAFPTIFLTDAQGKIVHETGYQRGGPKPYVAMLKSKMPGVN